MALTWLPEEVSILIIRLSQLHAKYREGKLHKCCINEGIHSIP